MIKFFVCIALLLEAAPALAQVQPAPAVPDAPEVPAAPAKIADRVICKRVEQIGSRLGAKKVCMPKSQWDEQRLLDREQVQDLQRLPN